MLPRIVSFALAAVCALLVVHPADGVIIRYESVIQLRGGQVVSTATGFGRQFLMDEYIPLLPDLGPFGPVSYINFEINTETAQITNYYIAVGGKEFGRGTVTVAEGTGSERVIELGDEPGDDTFVLSFIPQAPVTRIRFQESATPPVIREFLLEVEGNLVENTTGGRVDISPFRPFDELGNGQTPLEVRSLFIPLSILGNPRTGSFGLETFNFDFPPNRTFGPTEENLGVGDPFGEEFFLQGTVISTCSGDANLDGLIDTGDLLALLANFGEPTTSGASDGDFDGSGSVDTGDLLALLAAFGTACP